LNHNQKQKQMNRLILTILVALPLVGFSQSTIDTLCFELPYRKLAPAPCSIEDTSTTETRVYMVKVGLYDRNIEAREYIIKIDLGSQYHYFYNQLFRSRDKATNAMKNLRELGYCDAYVVELPSFIMGFEFNEPKQTTSLAKPNQLPTSLSKQPQSGAKVTWVN
jgi:hypothetical protein